MNKLVNYGELLTNEQLLKCIKLLDKQYYENISIYIVKSKFQFFSLGLSRKNNVALIQAITDLLQSKNIGGHYGVLRRGILNKKTIKNIIIYEYSKDLNKYPVEERKVMLVYVLFHELKHKEQFKSCSFKQIREMYKKNRYLYEKEADEFAIEMIKEHKESISKILGIGNFDIKIKP
jgi:hypothetical protein